MAKQKTVDEIKQTIRDIMHKNVQTQIVDWQTQLVRKKLVSQQELHNSFQTSVSDENSLQVSFLLYGFWLDRNRYVQYNNAMPNVASLADWITAKGLQRFRYISGISPERANRLSTQQKTNALAFAIAKHKKQRGGTPKNRSWVFKTFWNNYHLIFPEIYTALSDAEFALLQQALNQNNQPNNG